MEASCLALHRQPEPVLPPPWPETSGISHQLLLPSVDLPWTRLGLAGSLWFSFLPLLLPAASFKLASKPNYRPLSSRFAANVDSILLASLFAAGSGLLRHQPLLPLFFLCLCLFLSSRTMASAIRARPRRVVGCRQSGNVTHPARFRCQSGIAVPVLRLRQARCREDKPGSAEDPTARRDGDADLHGRVETVPAGGRSGQFRYMLARQVVREVAGGGKGGR